MLADNNLRVRAAGRRESALASWYQPVAGGLVGVNTADHDPGAQLSIGSPGEIHREDGHKHNGDDEHGSPSPGGTLYRGFVRTYRQTR